jgi:hypothetical protein
MLCMLHSINVIMSASHPLSSFCLDSDWSQPWHPLQMEPRCALPRHGRVRMMQVNSKIIQTAPSYNLINLQRCDIVP